MSSSETGNLQPDKSEFAATRWTLVLSAARDNWSTHAAEAMAELCRLYWYPLYAFVRRRGFETHEAEDLTQEFFARLLSKNYLASVGPEKGKFRSFLLTSLQHFLANEWDRTQAQKRGGGRAIISLDGLTTESRYLLEPLDRRTPEKLFERQWALAVLERVLTRLETQWNDDGKNDLFQRLKGCLAGPEAAGYAEIGATLRMTEGAVKVAAHRLRRRYRELLREEIAHTVSSPEEIDEEIRYLLACVRE
jgi:RNA polymerase sigma factor (sigma-70 family)